jgi:hypothetical protein
MSKWSNSVFIFHRTPVIVILRGISLNSDRYKYITMTICPAPNCVYEHKGNLLLSICWFVETFPNPVWSMRSRVQRFAQKMYQKKNQCVATDTPERSWWGHTRRPSCYRKWESQGDCWSKRCELSIMAKHQHGSNTIVDNSIVDNPR